MDTDPADWSTALQDSYLNSALWVVYYGMLTYGFDGHFSLPAEPAELVDLVYIQTWPLNPYNNWEPMQVLDPTDEFSPGDLCLLVPVGQREHGSKMASELCVYGPDIDYALHGDAEPMDINEDWVVVPDGAVYMLGIG